MKINSFRDLRVWQGGMELVEQVYRLTDRFPKEETYGLRNALSRKSDPQLRAPNSQPPIPEEQACG